MPTIPESPAPGESRRGREQSCDCCRVVVTRKQRSHRDSHLETPDRFQSAPAGIFYRHRQSAIHSDNISASPKLPYRQPRLSSARSPSRRPKQSHSCRRRNPAVNGPLSLSRHKTSRQDVDALQEPDSADQNKQAAQNATSDSHSMPPMVESIT